MLLVWWDMLFGSVGVSPCDPMEALDLVKNSCWRGITDLSESRHETWQTGHAKPDNDLHVRPYSMPLPLVNGISSVPPMRTRCPPVAHQFMNPNVELDNVLLQTKRCHRFGSKNSILGIKTAHCVLQTHPKDSERIFGGFTRAQTEDFQCSTRDGHSRHSTSLSEQTIELLASEYARSKARSKYSVKYISSDDDSDVIEVPVSNSRQETASSPPCQSVSTTVHATTCPTRRSPRIKQKADCSHQNRRSPRNVNRVNANYGAGTESCMSWMESVLMPTSSEEESNQDADSSGAPENFPCSSENLNTLETSAILPSSSVQTKRQSSPALKSRAFAKPVSKLKPKEQVRQGKGSPGVEGATAKRRRRKPKPSKASSLFAPKEPEIQLKYANLKEKRDTHPDSFTPYIHVDVSSCTIVNFRVEEDVSKKGLQLLDLGTVPKTSCFLLGHMGTDAINQGRSFCCLCRKAGNTEGLGDLHGPYLRSAAASTHRASHPDDELAQDGSDVESDCCLVETSCPSVGGQEGTEGDSSDLWVHEDCSIWSAGVFLVKGRLYGLEEAIQVAKTMICSLCHGVGATLGCFFKDCSNKYHFPCALQSGSALNEENFTMRCSRHKNKVSRASVSRTKSR